EGLPGGCLAWLIGAHRRRLREARARRDGVLGIAWDRQAVRAGQTSAAFRLPGRRPDATTWGRSTGLVTENPGLLRQVHRIGGHGTPVMYLDQLFQLHGVAALHGLQNGMVFMLGLDDAVFEHAGE